MEKFLDNVFKWAIYFVFFMVIFLPMAKYFDKNILICFSLILSFFAGLINSIRNIGIRVKFILPNTVEVIYDNIEVLPTIGNSYFIAEKEYIVEKINFIHNKPIQIVLNDRIN